MQSDGLVPTGANEALQGFESGKVDPRSAPLLSFSGADGGLNEDEFNIEIQNTTANQETARIFPRPFHAGGIQEGDSASADGTSGVFSSEGSPKSIDVLNDFIDQNPSFISKVKIISGSNAQLQKSISFNRVSPFRDLNTHNLQPANRQNEYRNINNEVTFQAGVIQSNQTFIEYPVRANETIDLILFFKAFLSTSVLFERQLEALRASM